MAEPVHITWMTLVPYLADRVTSARETISTSRTILAEAGVAGQEADEFVAGLEAPLNQLLWLEPLVREMLSRPALQSLRPTLSLQIVRLLSGPGVEDEFAWIQPLAEGRFLLSRVRNRGLLDYENSPECEGDAAEVADSLERIVAGRGS